MPAAYPLVFMWMVYIFQLIIASMLSSTKLLPNVRIALPSIIPSGLNLRGIKAGREMLNRFQAEPQVEMNFDTSSDDTPSYCFVRQPDSTLECNCSNITSASQKGYIIWSNHLPNQSCSIDIVAPQHKRVQLTVLKKLLREQAEVHVYDFSGHIKNSGNMYYCNLNDEVKFISSGNVIRLSFNSKNQVRGSVFSQMYSMWHAEYEVII